MNRMILTIARHELRRLFLSPLAWTILAVVQLVLGWMFLSHLDYYLSIQSRLMGMDNAPGVTEAVVAPLFGNSAIVLLLVAPLVSMRVFTEERRNKTLAMLVSAPLSMSEIVLGKYLGLLTFLWLQLLMIALMPLSLLVATGLDLGLLASGLLGLALLLAGFAAVGVFMSSLTQHQTVAAVSTFGVLLLFWILDWTGAGSSGGALAYLSLLNHYEPFLKGVFDTRDAVFHAVFIALFLALSVRRLDMDRLGG
jgi:ABC-2 type transport system permease protein